MYDCFIISRSITTAQKLSRTLGKAGYKASVRKLPSGTADTGCGYSVRVPGGQIAEVLRHLKEIEYGPARVLCEYEDGRLEEYGG